MIVIDNPFRGLDRSVNLARRFAHEVETRARPWRRPVYNRTMNESGASFGGQAKKKFEGAGGTPGGIGEFLLGILLAGIGFYIVFSHVQVHSSYWSFFGAGGAGRSFGISLIPLLFGIGFLFANGRSLPGWVLTIGGLLLILVGIIVNLDIHFHSTSLMNTIIMLGLIAAGFGLVVKSLRPHKRKSETAE